MVSKAKSPRSTTAQTPETRRADMGTVNDARARGDGRRTSRKWKTDDRKDSGFSENVAPSQKPRHWLTNWILNGNLHDWILRIIAFLLAFGILSLFFDYILTNVRASACTPVTTTIWVPFTETSTITISTATPLAQSGTPTAEYTTVSTTTVSTRTVTTTLSPQTVSEPYLFTVSSGSTVWQQGHTPPSGASITVAGTTTLYVTPEPPHSTTTLSTTSTIRTTTTVFTLPAYSSTVYSIAGDGETTTLTSTSRRTITLSRVSTHSSFSSRTEGWNTTSTAQPVMPPPETTTLTQVIYYGNENSTTSTLTSRITTYVGATATSDSGTTYTAEAAETTTTQTQSTVSSRSASTSEVPEQSTRSSPTSTSSQAGLVTTLPAFSTAAVSTASLTRVNGTMYTLSTTASTAFSVSANNTLTRGTTGTSPPASPSYTTSSTQLSSQASTVTLSIDVTSTSDGIVQTTTHPSLTPPTSVSATTRLGSSSANSSASATSGASCGEQGRFSMNFDDLPTFTPGRLPKRQMRNATANGTDVTQYPPLSLKPHRHMLFSGGYVYAPKAVEPFTPSSPPNVAVFLAEGSGLHSGQNPNDLEPGEIADGPYHEGDPAFFFDAYNAAVGCDNDSPTQPCTMEVTSYVWDNKTRDDVPSHAQNYTLPPCENFKDCKLTKVDFPDTFRKLSGIRMRAICDQKPRMFFVDDMNMGWADNSCSAGLQRERSP